MNEENKQRNLFERFIEAIESWIKPPAYSDPALQRKSEILHTMTFMILGIGFSVLAITPFIFIDHLSGVFITLGVMFATLLIQILNRKGNPKAAANIFVGAILAFDFGMILFSGGFQSQFLVTFISISIMGGLILGEMFTFHIAGISIAAYLALFYIDLQGLTPPVSIQFSLIAIILINVVNLLLAATVLFMVLQKYEENFKAYIEKDQALELTNLVLKEEAAGRERAQNNLQQSEKRLKSALMESPFPTMLHTHQGEILLVNTAWIQNTGFNPVDLPIFKDWLDHVFRESSDSISEMLDQIQGGEETEKDGLFTLFNRMGEPLKWYLHWTKLPALPDGRDLYLVMGTDLTKLELVETALREREETLSIFTLITNDGIWDWDLSTDRVIYDSRYYTMAGYEVDEFPYQLEEFRKRIHPDDVEKVFSEADRHLNGEIDRFIVEFRFLQKDGSWLWIMGRGKITEQDEYGSPKRFVGTHTDISTQKVIEEELNEIQLQLQDIVEDRTKKLNERVTEVERLNAALTNILDDYQAANERLSLLGDNLTTANQEMESLTYSLSTDLLLPVHTILDTARKLSENQIQSINKGDPALVQNIISSAELVRQQIIDLLRISQLSQQDLQIETLDLPELLENVLNGYRDQIKESDIQITIKNLPPCEGDRELVELVLDNLISNSIKFASQEKIPEILVGYQPDQDSDRAVYFIKDNGVGFDPKDQDLVFSTFQQLNKEEDQPGTGVGLTLAKLIINKHGGKIWADSEKGKGATFYFDLASPEPIEA